MLSFPIIVPGFKTELHPTSDKSPKIAPSFLKPVSILSVPYFTFTNVPSDFKLEVIAPAPKWDLYPNIESPT